MGSWLFGNNAEVNKPQPPAASMRLQTSVEGRPLPMLWGQTRIAGNIIWYGFFRATAIQQQGSSGGGKGAPSGGGGKGQQGAVTYRYAVSVAIGLTDGEIADVPRVWANKSDGVPSNYGLTIFEGTVDQAPWGYLTSFAPTEALNYRLLSYAAAEALDLGSNTEMPNFSFEVKALYSDAISGQPDANPRDVIVDFLTNVYNGVSFPPWRLDSNMTDYSNQCLALGLVISPALVEQKEASQFLADVLRNTHASARWSDGILTVVPWYDEAVTANGVTYTPDTTPLYDIDDDDLLPMDGDSGDPIQIKRKKQSDLINDVKLTYLSRDADYDPVAIDAKNEASIQTYGLRPSDNREGQMLCTEAAAVLSAHLQLNREQIANEYTFRLPPQFILVDVEDILTLTRYSMGMYRVPVRVVDIEEEEDGSLVFKAEDYFGTASAPLYGSQASEGHTTNTNVDPGSTNEPTIFEPTAVLLAGQTLEVWGAVSGEDTDNWGGCNVYVSLDGVNYQKQEGQVRGPARMGVLTAPLPSVTPSPTGLTIDETNTLTVDLAESGGELLSGSQTDVLSLNTACYVNGEIVAYRDATLITGNEYDLDYLVRGAYGTDAEIDTHPVGSKFARLDQGIFKIPFDKTQIGDTLYIKLQSFNIWGGGLQDLSDIDPYTYVITGSALAAPLDDIQNLTSKFVDGRLNLSWDELVDFRADIRYEVRKGATFEGGLTLGIVAHPPFAVPGDGTYWVSGWCQPTPDLIVRSENAVSLTVTNAFISTNVAATFDCKTEGWPGIFTNAGVDMTLDAVRTAGAGNILDEADILTVTDLLNLGGNISGTYRPTFYIDVGRVAPCAITITWRGTGIPHDQNILTIEDILVQPDILGSASAAFVNVYPEVLISQESTGDILSAPDVLDVDDVLTYGIPFASPIKYSPGTFVGRVFAFQFQLETVDPETIALLLEATITVDMPDRLDTTGEIGGIVTSLTNLTIPAAGIAITFVPTGDDEPAAFIGGPDGEVGSLPQIQVTCGAQVEGDTLVITNWSLVGATIQWQNGGVGVERTKNNISILGF